MNHSQHQTPDIPNGRIFRAKWVLLAFIVVAAYFLITEHEAHLGTALLPAVFAAARVPAHAPVHARWSG